MLVYTVQVNAILHVDPIMDNAGSFEDASIIKSNFKYEYVSFIPSYVEHFPRNLVPMYDVRKLHGIFFSVALEMGI